MIEQVDGYDRQMPISRFYGELEPLTDAMTVIERSALMSRIRSKNTWPEMVVRRIVHAMGYRYRLHRGDLPGTPDLVFPRKKKVIFIHGCFWHRHDGCRYAATPKTRPNFWEEKLNRNVKRDKDVIAELKDLGWTVLVVWECETKDLERIKMTLRGFLN